MMWKKAHFCSLYQNSRQRRHALRAAATGLADAERIPFTVLLFLLLGLPLLLRPALFTDFAALQWWTRIWTPVWILVTCVLYAVFYLPRVPGQIVGAAVDAMEQSDPDIEFVLVQGRIETICLQALVPSTIHRQTTVHARTYGAHAWHDRHRRRRMRLRGLDFPARRFVPLPSSSRDSSD